MYYVREVLENGIRINRLTIKPLPSYSYVLCNADTNETKTVGLKDLIEFMKNKELMFCEKYGNYQVEYFSVFSHSESSYCGYPFILNVIDKYNEVISNCIKDVKTSSKKLSVDATLLYKERGEHLCFIKEPSSLLYMIRNSSGNDLHYIDLCTLILRSDMYNTIYYAKVENKYLYIEMYPDKWKTCYNKLIVLRNNLKDISYPSIDFKFPLEEKAIGKSLKLTALVEPDIGMVNNLFGLPKLNLLVDVSLDKYDNIEFDEILDSMIIKVVDLYYDSDSLDADMEVKAHNDDSFSELYYGYLSQEGLLDGYDDEDEDDECCSIEETELVDAIQPDRIEYLCMVLGVDISNLDRIFNYVKSMNNEFNDTIDYNSACYAAAFRHYYSYI